MLLLLLLHLLLHLLHLLRHLRHLLHLLLLLLLLCSLCCCCNLRRLLTTTKRKSGRALSVRLLWLLRATAVMQSALLLGSSVRYSLVSKVCPRTKECILTFHNGRRLTVLQRQSRGTSLHSNSTLSTKRLATSIRLGIIRISIVKKHAHHCALSLTLSKYPIVVLRAMTRARPTNATRRTPRNTHVS